MKQLDPYEEKRKFSRIIALNKHHTMASKRIQIRLFWR